MQSYKNMGKRFKVAVEKKKKASPSVEGEAQFYLMNIIE